MDHQQAIRFERDGYLRLRGVVPLDMALAARRCLFSRIGHLHERAGAIASAPASAVQSRAVQDAHSDLFRTADDPLFIDLYKRTDVRRITEAGIGGRGRPVRRAQLALLFPGAFDEHTNETGYLNRDTPHHGWAGHLDGLWNGGIAAPPAGTNIRGKALAAWRSAPSTNGMFKTSPQHNCNLSNFTALVGVALSDQRADGAGNLGLLKGAHRHMAAFFRSQNDQGGPLGPDGPDWPRENPDAPNHHGLVHYPPSVRSKYRRAGTVGSDGHVWPKPTFMKLNLGDAVIVHALTPHSASLVSGSDPRFMIYFRITAARRREEHQRVYPAALCDHLLEWRGVRRALA